MEDHAGQITPGAQLHAAYERLAKLEKDLVHRAAQNTSLGLSPELPHYINQLARLQDYSLYIRGQFMMQNTRMATAGITQFLEDVKRFEEELQQFLLPWT